MFIKKNNRLRGVLVVSCSVSKFFSPPFPNSEAPSCLLIDRNIYVFFLGAEFFPLLERNKATVEGWERKRHGGK